MHQQFTATRRVMAAVDNSRAAGQVLAYAAGVAKAVGARLIVLHVTGFSGSPLDLGIDEPKDPQADASTSQEIYGAFVKEIGDVPTEFANAEGRAQDVILEQVRNRDVDLLVVGTHGRTGIEAAFHHSVSEALVRLCPCPVLSVLVKTSGD